MAAVPTMVVEIHVPLLPTPDLPEVFDEGEEDGDVYVFVVTGAGEGDLLALASSMATLPGAPAGSVAVVSIDGAEEFGLGRRVARPLSAP
ncbi:hypothetical protein OIE52_45715 [Streptomyces canus]|uniref:hypothetical protein n=1 Tax=Streptomyces canus TaxID=58343 RepID=UPI002E2DC04C|nr:hypothetical protein [Streptomyces canus]